MALKPIQKKNIRYEKMQNILQAMGDSALMEVSRDEAGEIFPNHVVNRITLSYDGKIIQENEGAIDDADKLDAFNVDMRKEYISVKDPKDRHYPLYVCDLNGERCFIVSFSGKGLWDDIWGYLGIKSNGVDVCGAVFDHKGETPGLGSKITEDWFQEQFFEGDGKKISKDGKYAPIKVLKPGKELNAHQVDGISGGTFTGAGVTEMLDRCLVAYYNFFQTAEGKALLK